MLELKFSLTKSFTIGKGGDVLIIGTDTGLRMCKEISIFPRKGYFRVSEDQWLTCREISSECSRGVSRGRPDLIPGIVEQAFNIERIEFINVVIDELDTVFAIGIAIAKSFPMFSAKEGYDRFDRFANQQINVRFLCFDRNVAQKQIDLLNYCYSSIRNTARIVDTPACDMNVSHMIQEARLVVEKLNEISDNGKIEIEVINGIDLLTQGFGGIYAVGKGAQESPALVQLSFKPANTPKDVIALIGKGVVYDTGGLALKRPADKMFLMKTDMGGAAGILYSFDALVRSRLVDDLEIHAILCLAENATGPNSYRNGDIIRMHSKKTVEIWNTDAEGRILLGDAVSYAADQLKASLIIDMATLTGAQGISTGQKHAAIYSNSEELEKLATIAGRYSGDLTHPLPYIPEFLRSDISSPIADLRNAAASQNNAYSACAAQFIGEHLPHSFSGKWLHIDMARPSKRGDLSSAYGPALLLSLIPAIYSMR